jgi:hypothetical protein
VTSHYSSWILKKGTDKGIGKKQLFNLQKDELLKKKQCEACQEKRL